MPVRHTSVVVPYTAEVAVEVVAEVAVWITLLTISNMYILHMVHTRVIIIIMVQISIIATVGATVIPIPEVILMRMIITTATILTLVSPRVSPRVRVNPSRRVVAGPIPTVAAVAAVTPQAVPQAVQVAAAPRVAAAVAVPQAPTHPVKATVHHLHPIPNQQQQ